MHCQNTMLFNLHQIVSVFIPFHFLHHIANFKLPGVTMWNHFVSANVELGRDYLHSSKKQTPLLLF